jgi:hypothetical protein
MMNIIQVKRKSMASRSSDLDEPVSWNQEWTLSDVGRNDVPSEFPF